MKFIKIVTLLASLIVLANCFRISQHGPLNRPPTAKEVAQEYIVQNTANHLVRENMVKSAIDHNPNNYKILNGQDAAHDPEMKVGTPDPRYPEPYYPYYNPENHRADPPQKPRTFSEPLNRYTASVYQNDQKPYYGPPESFRTFLKPEVGTERTPIQMADLTDAIPSNAKIQDLQRELDHLKNYVSGPKYLYDQTSKVYSLDPGAYYDPTMNDKITRMNYLQERIDYLTDQMKKNYTAVKGEERTASVNVQNFTNKNKEETNGFIARSYYYQVGNSPAPKAEKDPKFEPKQVPLRKSNVQEVDKSQLVEQKEITASNYNANTAPPQRTETGEYKGYKTVSSNVEQPKAKKDLPTSFSPTQAPRDPPMQNPTLPMPTSVQTDYVAKTTDKKVVKTEVKPAERKDAFVPKPAPRDPATPNTALPMPTSIQTVYVPNTSSDRKSSNLRTEEKAEEKKVEKKVETPKPVEKKAESKVEAPIKDQVEKKVEKEAPKPVEETKVEKVEASKPVERKAEVKKVENVETPKPVVEKKKSEKVEKVEKTEEKVVEKKVESKPVEKKEEVKKVEENAENKTNKIEKKDQNPEAESKKDVPHRLNTQGLKYETVKIVH